MRKTIVLMMVLAFATIGFAQKPIVVAVAPFFDDTGTPAGERSAMLLPVMIMERAKSAGFVTVIINLGPEWTPADRDWPAELARKAGADVVLVGQVRALSTESGKKPSDLTLRGHVLLAAHAANLVVEAGLLDVSSGRELTSIQTKESVKGSWLEEAAAHYTPLGVFHHESFWFANTHFGQAISRSAEKLVENVAHNLSGVQPGGAYNIVPAGPILMHVTVKDAPYRQMVQNDYYATSMLDCSRPDRSLAFEIGSAGEGVLR